MGDCFTQADASNFATKDTNRVIGTIAKALAANSPFMNVLKGGTFANGISDQVRSVVQLPAAAGDSLVAPEFTNDTDVCGQYGSQNLTDTVEYLFRLQTLRGFGPRVCVKDGRAAFKSSYTMAEDALTKLITQYINSDIKYQLYAKSASKYNAAAGYKFSDMFTGGEQNNVGIPFAHVLPSARLTFAALHKVARHLKEALFADMFGGTGLDASFRFIGSADIVEAFRDEVGVKDVLVGLTTGGYKLGEVSLSAYSFASAPAYRGISLGIDQTPLRFNTMTNGVPNFIEPDTTTIDVVTHKGSRKRNPVWLAAAYEMGFLIAENTFERLVPEKYVGEGSFKFAPQLHMGELDWHYQVDNDCNVYGDFGFHKFQITRAYRPIRPQHVVPIVYARCDADLGLVACEHTAPLPYTGGSI